MYGALNTDRRGRGRDRDGDRDRRRGRRDRRDDRGSIVNDVIRSVTDPGRQREGTTSLTVTGGRSGSGGRGRRGGERLLDLGGGRGGRGGGRVGGERLLDIGAGRGGRGGGMFTPFGGRGGGGRGGGGGGGSGTNLINIPTPEPDDPRDEPMFFVGDLVRFRFDPDTLLQAGLGVEDDPEPEPIVPSNPVGFSVLEDFATGDDREPLF